MALEDRTRRMAGAAAIVMAAYVSSRVTGLLRDIAVGYHFGTGRELDAYLAANRVPDLVFQLVAGAAVTSAFIPVYSSYLAKNDRAAGSKLVSILFTVSVVGLLPIVLIVMQLAPLLMRLMAPGFPPDLQALAANLSRIVLLAPIFFAVGCFCTSLLNAHGRFLLASLAPTSYNVGIIIGAVFFSRWLGIYGLAVGALFGSVLFLLVQLPGVWYVGYRFRPSFDLKHPGVRAVARLMGPRALGLAVTQVNFVVTLYLASGIAGGVAALNYAWILTMLPLGVFAIAISTAVFPSLAELGASQDHLELRRTLEQALRFILYLIIPASIGLMALSPEIVRLVYERGEFTAASTLLTSNALRFYAAGLFGMATVEIVTRAFYAMRDTRTPVKVAAVAMLTNLALGLTLVRVMGIDGLALSTAVASTIEATILFSIGRRRIPGLTTGSLIGPATRSLIAAAAMGIVVLIVIAATAPLDRILGGVLVVGMSVGLGAVTYLVGTIALGSTEAASLRRLLIR